MPASTMSSSSLINATLGSFVVRELIGAGGVAEVYRAEHVEDQKSLALKALRYERLGEKDKLKAFQDEFRWLSQLRHPGIPLARRTGEIQGRPCILMDYVPGETLAVLQAKGRQTPGVGPLLGLVGIVAYLHERRLIHNDIKLENTILRPDGGVSLVDFGSVKEVQADNVITRFFTRTPKQIFGTATYLAPEIIAGKRPTLATDVYALGVCAFMLLTGKPPFDATRQSGRLRANASERPPSIRERLPQITPALAHGIDACLAKSADERPADARALLGLIKELGRSLTETGVFRAQRQP
jgi:serine/threonine-protein kinase